MGGKARGRVKRQHIETDDGWTVITHGVARLGVRGKAAHSAGDALPAQTVDGLTAEKMLVDTRRLQEQWKATAVARQVEKLMSKKWPVDEAVCVGIGSLSRDWEHRHRSMWQLVLFLDVVEQLSRQGSTLRMFAQDPAFTPLDREFLQRLNVTVVAAGIERHIGPRSLVYSPFVDWYVLLPTLLASREPLVYVGNEILDDYSAYAQTEDKKERLAHCNELGKSFLEGRSCVKLEDFEQNAHALNGMVVYWNDEIGGTPT